MKIYFEHDDLMLIDLKYLYIFPHWQFANFLARIEKTSNSALFANIKNLNQFKTS